MKNVCKLCKKQEIPIYTSIGYKMTPLCLDCYKENRIPAKNKYKKLINKLANMGYVWVLNVGNSDFPFTFFGLEVPFYQIVQYFFQFIDSDKYNLVTQDDYVFDFNDYPDPVVTESSIVFENEEDGTIFTLNIRMGKYNYKRKELLFFNDKQLGLKKSNLANYATYFINDKKEIIEVVPDFEDSYLQTNQNFPAYDNFDDYFYEKSYMDTDEVQKLVGFSPDLDMNNY